MRKIHAYLIKTVYVACLTSIGSLAYGADGTIQFTGNITTDACTVDATSAGTQTANLGTIASTAFTSSGDAAGSAPFQILLTACPATVTSVSVR
ncbi:fimbrial protein, partial [Enterobacter cloacae complex sp. P4RS]